jgi:hypothetical protein
MTGQESVDCTRLDASGTDLFLLRTHSCPTLRNVGQDLVVCHGRVGLLHRLADFVLEQEIRGRRTLRRVRVARLLDPLPFRTLPLLGVVGLAFADPVRLGRNDWRVVGEEASSASCSTEGSPPSVDRLRRATPLEA